MAELGEPRRGWGPLAVSVLAAAVALGGAELQEALSRMRADELGEAIGKAIVAVVPFGIAHPALRFGLRCCGTGSSRLSRLLSGALLLLAAYALVSSTSEGFCVNLDAACERWAESGECSRNSAFMAETCPRACGLCCGDRISSCPQLVSAEQASVRCAADPFLKEYCARTCDAGACSHSSVLGEDEPAPPPKVRRRRPVPDTCIAATSAATPPPPLLIFGTAWRGEDTAAQTLAALRHGVRAIDTAAQPKHYSEAAVGEALATAAAEGVAARQQLFVQTKFTPIKWQEREGLPYPEDASIEEQVAASVQSSLRNLRTDYVDSLLLHGVGSAEELMRTWRAMEAAHDAGQTRSLGVCNVQSARSLALLWEHARVKPKWVQNAFRQRSAYDRDVRGLCAAANITYQAYRLHSWREDKAFTAAPIRALASAHGLSDEGAWMAAVSSLGLVPLTGTANEEHLRENLAGAATRLRRGEAAAVRAALEE